MAILLTKWSITGRSSTGLTDSIRKVNEISNGKEGDYLNESTRKAMFSSETDLWATPQDFYDRLHVEFKFTLDPCSDGTNNKCANYFTAAEDGLAQDWAPHTTFMNPPYGRGIGNWIKKAYEESEKGATVVALIPSRTDTRYWHDYVMKAAEIRLIKNRLYFNDGSGRAPFPSAVIIFRKHDGDVPKLNVMGAN